MKAVVQEKYGAPDEVLRLQEIDVPQIRDDQVLVKVRAASVHPDVWHVVTGWPYILRLMGAGLRRPKNPVPGTDVAGVVEAVGADVTRFAPGDEVFGETFIGMQWRNGGSFAEYVAAPQDALVHKPGNVGFEQAAAVPSSGFIAAVNLQLGKRIQAGHSVLINGAAGSVGSIAVQLARAHGARVTAVDTTEKLDLLRRLGADQVIDYTAEDFTRRDERHDFILDVASNLTLSSSKRALKPNGIYVLIGHDHFGTASGRIFGSLPRFIKLMALAPFRRHLPQMSFKLPSKQEVLTVLRQALESGQLTPVIDRIYPLGEAAAALRHLQEGRARGRILLAP